jgi:hypothetical protein
LKSGLSVQELADPPKKREISIPRPVGLITGVEALFHIVIPAVVIVGIVAVLFSTLHRPTGGTFEDRWRPAMQMWGPHVSPPQPLTVPAKWDAVSWGRGIA